MCLEQSEVSDFFFYRSWHSELPEEYLEQSMNLINFPQRSNQHIILKYMGNKKEHLPRSYPSLSLPSVLQMLLSLGSIARMQSWRMTGECGGKDQFIPSSNQCAIWIHLNALNHAPNVDGSRVWASVMQECYIALVWTHFIKYLSGKKKKVHQNRSEQNYT